MKKHNPMPCPKCGCANPEMIRFLIVGLNKYAYACPKCGFLTKMCYTKRGAVRKWNKSEVEGKKYED